MTRAGYPLESVKQEPELLREKGVRPGTVCRERDQTSLEARNDGKGNEMILPSDGRPCEDGRAVLIIATILARGIMHPRRNISKKIRKLLSCWYSTDHGSKPFVAFTDTLAWTCEVFTRTDRRFLGRALNPWPSHSLWFPRGAMSSRCDLFHRRPPVREVNIHSKT
jgi:hypothetical protein